MVNPGQNILTQETIIKEISSTTVLKSYKKTKTLPCISAHVPNNSDISIYVTYCYYYAKQRIIGYWNKSFSKYRKILGVGAILRNVWQ